MVAKLGILGSGEGSNMVAIADACASGLLPAKPLLVLSDVSTAPILDAAKSREIESKFIEPGPFQSKLSDEAEALFIKALQDIGIDWVLLAGFMRIIKSPFLRAFPERIVNIHPSLLPSFPGLNAPQQALDYGVQVTGSTVHMVDQGIDTGAILAQAPVVIETNDTADTLHTRIKQTEHRLFPQAMADLINGKIRVSGRQVTRR